MLLTIVGLVMQTQPQSNREPPARAGGPRRRHRAGASRPAAAAILLLAMLVSAGLALTARLGNAPADVAHPRTAVEWLTRAEALEQAGDRDGAERACRAALAREPWHPATVRKLTLLLLDHGDEAALKDWMDDLILGDARLAEQAFDLPDFAPWLEQPAFQALLREARIQARD